MHIKWFGKYRGRWYHDVIAVTGRLAEGGALAERVKNLGWDFEEWHHQDNFGFDYIMSWNVSWFRSDDKTDQPKSEKELWMDAVKEVRV